ncbi:ATP-dependent DNA helicase RecG, partial [Candidatus Saccharibacteria bacterium]|nr:ATP-dependent DNA helicase RecG [Candidatus Saccharibacteria bacterium]
QPYRVKQFDKDKEYYFIGNYDLNRGRYQLTSPTARLAAEVEDKSTSGGFQPIYSTKGSFKSANFKKIFDNLRNKFAFIPDLLPLSDSNPDFVYPGSRADALFKVHYAEDSKEVESGRKYLAYEELFELILAASLNKIENQKLRGVPLKFSPEKIKRFVNSLPFALTNAQRKAAFQIIKDMERAVPMNRLLQGDVGSGKTVVAAISAFEAITNGYQVALLAPTAILATQHADSLEKLLSPFGISVGLLTGATKKKDFLKRKIREGKVDLIVGTHALLTDDTKFKSLALCIIDEQHRFGVNQRQKLLEKTLVPAPHLLMMTATPIPRSLQLTIFGDLDVSILNELPAGRQPVATKIISELNFADELYPKIREYLGKGQQIYWICKIIEDSSVSEAASVKKQTEKLKKVFPTEVITFLHGRMKPAEKDAIMSDFAAGKINILVSTTVVEVGVNVPNANLMVIMDADGYGLAQLHQLRGRIGRGSDAAICFLALPAEVEPSRRLKTLEKSNDGFYLAEADLKLRGPGEIYGSLQHGALNLQFASLTDSRLVAAASENAKACARAFAKDPELMLKYPELGLCIKKYQQLTTLN